MSVRLILNADDFGLTRGINRAVGELFAAGALTSATLMANGAAFADAVEVSQASPGLGVGCHVVLTDGLPLCHPHEIPTLLGADGKSFRASLVDFAQAVLRGRVREEDMVREAAAQVQRLQRAGIDVTHLDTHKHTHIFPAVARALLFVAERAGVPAIRNPFEPGWALKLKHADLVRQLQVRALNIFRERFLALAAIRSGSIVTTEGTLGVSATGRLDAATLGEVSVAAPPGTWEIVLHPGYNDRDLDAVRTRLRATRDVERAALLAVFGPDAQTTSHPSRAEFIHYGNLGRAGVLRGLNQFERATGFETIV